MLWSGKFIGNNSILDALAETLDRSIEPKLGYVAIC